MLTYRPQRKTLTDSLNLAIKFKTIDELKEYVVNEHKRPNGMKCFDTSDVVIDEMAINEHRIGWENVHYVCIKRYMNTAYDVPQCVGMVNIED